MKFKTFALFLLCYMGFSCAANADIYFRNFDKSFQVAQYYADFYLPNSLPKLGQISKLNKTNAPMQISSGDDPLQFPDKNGKVDLTSYSLDGTSLDSALKQGYNRILVISMHTIDGAYLMAEVGIRPGDNTPSGITTPTFDPFVYSYNPSDILLVTIIDQSDQKKYGVDCSGSNPCAVVENLGTKPN